MTRLSYSSLALAFLALTPSPSCAIHGDAPAAAPGHEAHTEAILWSRRSSSPIDSDSTSASTPVSAPAHLRLDPRALPDAPSGNYAPQIVTCPSSRPSVRLASRLSDEEESWVQRRRNNTVDPIRRLLERANITGFDAAEYIDLARDNATALPNIGIAMSGGGYRALMNGAGFLSAADSRNNDDNDDDDDDTGTLAVSGLLQASTYLAGLSGGGWLVGSMFANNFSSVPELQRGESGSDDDDQDDSTTLWRFDRSIFRGPEESGIGLLNTVDYWTDVVEEVGRKDDGWDTSLTDFWGRALSYQLIGAPEGGPAFTFSSIADTDAFRDGETPFPILVADGRTPDERLISLNATVYEFNPYELGTWDPTTYGFAPLRWIASNFTDGEISRDSDSDDDGQCVRGFDNLGFVMGTSSSLFNSFLLENVTAAGDDAGVPSFVVNAVERVLRRFDRDENDIAQYAPNPFWRWDPTSNSRNADERQLTLVDGGLDLQNLPLHPLIQPMRALDVVFAVDSSADTDNNWPNGTALRATYDRAGTDIANGTLFPAVPDAETFLNRRLNQRPTFFGCDADNFTSTDGNSTNGDFVVPPLIVYLPNAPYSAHGNVSTFTPSYPMDQRDAIIRNGFNSATQGNATLDDQWPACVACAVMSRAWWKLGVDAPETCASCFERYCWDGEEESEPVESYDPEFIIGADWESEDNGAFGVRGTRGGVVVSFAVAALMTVW